MNSRESGKNIGGIIACIMEAQKGGEALYTSLKGNVVLINEDSLTALRTENARLQQDKRELVEAKRDIEDILVVITGEIEAIMRGEHGEDWADHFGPLFEMIQKSKAAVAKHKEKV